MARFREVLAGEGGSVHVLHGVGGAGKTSLVHAVFEEASATTDKVGLWVSASDPAGFRAAMLAVAIDQGADPAEAAAAQAGLRPAADLVWKYLDHAVHPWLLVIDNADDPTVLAGGWLRRSRNGVVMVTSRRAHSPVWREAVRHAVEVLPLHDAAQALCDLAPEAGGFEQAVKVAEKLGCLPLALNLAGSYLSSRLLEAVSMSEYADRLEEDPLGQLNRGLPAVGRIGAEDDPVARTWKLSLEALAGEGLPEATTLLRLMSCWSAEPMPLTVLARAETVTLGAEEGEPSLRSGRLEQALRGLIEHSLVAIVDVPRMDGPVRSVRSHRVLLSSVAAEVPERQRSPYLVAAASLLEAATPHDAVSAESQELGRVLAPHIAALVKREPLGEAAAPVVTLASRIAEQLHEGGDYTGAHDLAVRAAQAGERALGASDVRVMHALRRAGWALFRLGRFADSEEVLRRVFDDCERLFGPGHIETCESGYALAAPLCQMGRRAEGVVLLRRIAELQQQALGGDHVETLRTRATLLEHLVPLGDFEEFDHSAASVVAACESSLGSDHPTTLMARHNQAYGLFKRGQTAEALAVAERVLDDRSRVQGRDHQQALSAAVLLSWIYERTGRLQDAIDLGRRVVIGQERALGAEHPYLLANQAGLASQLASCDMREEAVEVASRYLEAAERVLGSSDESVVKLRRIVNGD